MFQIGQVVSYGATGICTVEDIRYESLSRAGTRKQEFYVLRPIATPTCTTFVPTTNSQLTGKMRSIFTKEQIDNLIDSVRGQQLDWIDDPRQRAERFGQILSQGITGDLLKLISCLYLEKMARGKAGRKFCATDEKLLSSAERMVSEEFSYALQIPKNQVSSYIAEKMEQAS